MRLFSLILEAEHLVSNFLSKYASINDAQEEAQKISSPSLEADKFATYSSASTYPHSYSANSNSNSAKQSSLPGYNYLQDSGKTTNDDLFKSSASHSFGSAENTSASVPGEIDAASSNANNMSSGASQSRSLFDFDYDDI